MSQNILINGRASLTSLENYLQVGLCPITSSDGRQGYHIDFSNPKFLEQCGKITKKFNSGFVERQIIGILTKRAGLLVDKATATNSAIPRFPAPAIPDDATVGKEFLEELAFALEELDYAAIEQKDKGVDVYLTAAFFKALNSKPHQEPALDKKPEFTVETLRSLILEKDLPRFDLYVTNALEYTVAAQQNPYRAEFAGAIEANPVHACALQTELENWDHSITSISFEDLMKRLEKRIPFARALDLSKRFDHYMEQDNCPGIISLMRDAAFAIDPHTPFDELVSSFAKWAKLNNFKADETASVGDRINEQLANFIGYPASHPLHDPAQDAFSKLSIVIWLENNHPHHFRGDITHRINFETFVKGLDFLLELYGDYNFLPLLKQHTPHNYELAIAATNTFNDALQLIANEDVGAIIEHLENFKEFKDVRSKGFEKEFKAWKKANNPEKVPMPLHKEILGSTIHQFGQFMIGYNKQVRDAGRALKALENACKHYDLNTIANMTLPYSKDATGALRSLKAVQEPYRYLKNALNNNPMNELEKTKTLTIVKGLEFICYFLEAQKNKEEISTAIAENDVARVTNCLEAILHIVIKNHVQLSESIDQWKTRYTPDAFPKDSKLYIDSQTLTLGLNYILNHEADEDTKEATLLLEEMEQAIKDSDSFEIQSEVKSLLKERGATLDAVQTDFTRWLEKASTLSQFNSKADEIKHQALLKGIEFLRATQE